MDYDIPVGLQGVRARIQAACQRADRPVNSVRLIGVSKLKPAEAVSLALATGLTDFGENYVQELLEKQEQLLAMGIKPTWHFIGRLQSRKVRMLDGRVQWIHSLDHEKQVKEIAKRFTAPINVLIEVNLGDEAQKGGISVGDLKDFALLIQGFPMLKLKGLMTIPPVTSDPEMSRPFFRELAQQLLELKAFFRAKDLDPSGLTELSMGMSLDFEQAIEEGATMVRVGTAIFGKRA